MQLSRLNEQRVEKLGSTVNIVVLARVAAEQSWVPGSRVVIKSFRGDLWARAGVIYCQPIGPKTFAVGLDLLAWTGEWIMRG